MAAIIPIHFAGAWLSSFLLKIIFFLLGRKSQSQCYINPIEYSLNNSWVVVSIRFWLLPRDMS